VASTLRSVRRSKVAQAFFCADKKRKNAASSGTVATALASQTGSNVPNTALNARARPIAPMPPPVQLEKVRSFAMMVRSSESSFDVLMTCSLADPLPNARPQIKQIVPVGGYPGSRKAEIGTQIDHSLDHFGLSHCPDKRTLGTS